MQAKPSASAGSRKSLAPGSKYGKKGDPSEHARQRLATTAGPPTSPAYLYTLLLAEVLYVFSFFKRLDTDNDGR